MEEVRWYVVDGSSAVSLEEYQESLKTTKEVVEMTYLDKVKRVRKVHEGVKKLVLKKMGNSDSCMITNTNTNEEYFFQKGSDGWTLYHGCDLVIGDCSLDQCVAVLASCAVN